MKLPLRILLSPFLISLLILICVIHAPAQELKPCPPLPSPRQLQWHELGCYAFIHFNMNTFTGKEWGDGKEDPKLFDPSRLDCGQWARICKAAGLRGIIITAKHHDGFCLWPSKYTEHSVKNSPFRNGKGDVLRELSQACRRYGLKMGVYISPWDRHEPLYGISPRYNEYYKNQLREVLTSYGDIFEVWFDGACGEGPNGKRQVYDWKGYFGVVRECQPDAVIFSDGGPDARWVGNEEGFAGETNWGFLRGKEVYPGYPRYHELTAGHANGTDYIPAECDVSIRPGWFYHSEQDTAVKSAGRLLDLYLKSVGRNANLLLNIPVDRRGLIAEQDARALLEFRRKRDAIFLRNLLRPGAVEATSTHAPPEKFDPRNAADRSNGTCWAAEEGAVTGELTIDLALTATFNLVMLQEPVAYGQRASAFRVDADEGSGWREIAAGTTIGFKRIIEFPAVTAKRIRIRILGSRASPAISNVALYHRFP